jgi:hypothetical protein
VGGAAAAAGCCTLTCYIVDESGRLLQFLCAIARAATAVLVSLYFACQLPRCSLQQRLFMQCQTLSSAWQHTWHLG